MNPKELREALHSLSAAEFRPLAEQAEIEEWLAVNRFCGKCGTPMVHHQKQEERAMVCPGCGYTAYPKITPAVIVLITKGDSILLQRNSHYGVPYGTLVAGFVDTGENFEEAVEREAMEEASIRIKNIRYFGSQSWPFPSNMMVAFRAEWAAGELKADGEEVISSGWYDREHLPALPRANSIARRMIDEWVAGR